MNLASYIDHTLLKPDATEKQIDQLIQDAKAYSFASVCVNPTWVAHCAQQLKESEVAVCTVIGFPLGATSTETKVFETKQALKDGATETDLVINIGQLKMKNKQFVQEEIAKIKQITNDVAILKVIIETALLTEDEKELATLAVLEAGAEFIKTSTGFSNGGATTEDIELFKRVSNGALNIKASGGIRDKEAAMRMIEAGANRIGASASVAIVEKN